MSRVIILSDNIVTNIHMHRVKEEEEEEEINKGNNIPQVIKSSQRIINQSQVHIILHLIHAFDVVYEGIGQIIAELLSFMLIFIRSMARKVKIRNQRLKW